MSSFVILLFWMHECCYIVHMPTPWGKGMTKTGLVWEFRFRVDKKPEQVFKIPVPVVEKLNGKSKNPVPVDKNRNQAQEIRFRFLKTLFRLSPMLTF